MIKPFLKVAPFALLGPIAAAIYLLREGYGFGPVFCTAVAMFLLFLPYLAFGRTNPKVSMVVSFGYFRAGMFKAVLFYLLTYLFYALGTSSFAPTSLLRLVAFLLVPAVLISLPRKNPGIHWLDFLAMAALWLPFDMGWLKEVWLWPENKGAYVLNTIMAVGYAVILFTGFRCLSGVGYFFRFKYRDFGVALIHFTIFFAIALSFGRYTDFISYNGSTNALKLIGAFIGIFFFIALPEELLFRGLLQNMLTQKFRAPLFALLTTSLLFGLTHLNNGPSPDWRYVVLATIAGVFYGRAFQKTQNLIAPALVHAGVDAVWVTFFMG